MNKYAVLVTVAIVTLIVGIVIGLNWAGAPQDQSTPGISSASMHEAGPFRLSIGVDPQIPEIGDNRLLIELTDLNNTPVDGAEINVVATMQAMGAMPEMRAPVTIQQTAPGRYEGPLDLPMDGSWPLTVAISKEGLGDASLRFEMATRRAGLARVSADPRSLENESAEPLPIGTITLDARRRQAIGLKTGEARRMPMERSVRAVGNVTYDETRLSDVTLRFDAWIGELNADYVGVRVEEGQTLFTAYGPDLLSAQQEYLEVKRRLATGALVDAARKRLQLWNLSDAEIAALERRGAPLDYVPSTLR